MALKQVTARLGIFGGTFDPPHRGHITLAAAAQRQLALDEVWFMPAGQPRLKSGTVTPANVRAEMTALATRGRPCFRVSRLEVDRPGVTYTVDTLAQLRCRLGPDVGLYFILSWQTLTTLARWRQPDRIIELAEIAAAPRPGAPRPDLTALERQLPGIGTRLKLIEMAPLDVSATAVRQMVARGESIREMVTPAVAAYIQRRGLYRDADR